MIMASHCFSTGQQIIIPNHSVGAGNAYWTLPATKWHINNFGIGMTAGDWTASYAAKAGSPSLSEEEVCSLPDIITLGYLKGELLPPKRLEFSAELFD